MKKLVSLLLALTMMLGLSAFALAEGDAYELALITDVGTIDDGSFNQGAWEGLEAYAVENDITHKYYQPKTQTTDEYLATIEMAVDGGAKVVVTPGYYFEEPIFIAQDMYPDVMFVLLDGAPHAGDYVPVIGENTVSITYAEEQSGFLAGYAVVKDGYTKLGFMGGTAVPAVVRFGYGFVQGAEYAAKEMGLDAVTVNYHYTGKFEATPEAQAQAAAWYNDGLEVIFACGGPVGNSVMAAAAASENKWVVGVDKDQSGDSETVITSAMKSLQTSVYNAIDAFYKGEFPGGQALVMGAEADGVSLPMETSRFATFSQADYDAIYQQLVAGEIEILKDQDVGSAAEIPTEITTVTLVD